MKENKAKILVLLILAVCVVTTRMTTRDRDITQIERLMADGFRPAQRIAMRFMRDSSTFLEGIARYPQAAEENERLRTRIAELEREILTNQEYRTENIRLRRLLDMRAEEDETLVAAEVIARGIKSWDDELTIDKGSLDGVSLYDGVMTYHGLVGKVFHVSDRSAKVRLLNNRLGSVPAMTHDTRFPGVIEGIGDGSGLLQLTYLPYDAPVEVNQTIVTSGLGNLIPKGVPIGYVSSVQYEEDGLIKRAIVTPFEDFDRLEEVLVIRHQDAEVLL